MARPLLSFVAIVKDEAANIRKTLESVRPFVDSWAVLDTGSVDDTPGIVCEAMRTVPGAFGEEPFVDFATTRNRVLAIDSVAPVHGGDPALFSIMLSGDETLEGGAELRAFLETKRDAKDGAYQVELRAVHANLVQSWTYPRVLRTGAGWRYVGKVHEIPVGPNGETTGPLIPGVRIVHALSDPERRTKRIREFDLPTLTEMVADESYSLAERAKAIFFLAQTHTTLAAHCNRQEAGGPWLSHQMNAMALYWRCGQLMEASESPAHDHDKAMYSYFFYYHIADNIGLYTSQELLPRLEILAEAAPRLPEARFLLAKHAATLDVRQGLFLAEEAARVAEAARAAPSYLPTDSRVEWMSLSIAAACAREMKAEQRMHELAARGVEVGGPVEVFQEFLG